MWMNRSCCGHVFIPRNYSIHSVLTVKEKCLSKQKDTSLKVNSAEINAKNSTIKHTTWLSRGGADAVESPFYELKLDEKLRNVGGSIRHRNYSLLFQPEDQRCLQSTTWDQMFSDPHLPLRVDLGCGAGRYILLSALKLAGRANMLGVEIHKALVERGNMWLQAKSLDHAAYFLNADACSGTLQFLATYPGPIELVSIQYPDLHVYKERHMVQPSFVGELARVIPLGCRVMLVSEMLDTARAMRDTFEAASAGQFKLDDLHKQPGAVFYEGLQDLGKDAVEQKDDVSLTAAETDVGEWRHGGWLVENPVGIPTEREVFVNLVTKSPIYRVMLVRC